LKIRDVHDIFKKKGGGAKKAHTSTKSALKKGGKYKASGQRIFSEMKILTVGRQRN
jgi:hypothetical protein